MGSAKIDSQYLGLHGRAAHRFGRAGFYVEPAVSASAIRLSLDAFEETGLGGLGMVADKSEQWVLSATPQVTLGSHIGSGLHLWLTGGVVLQDTDALQYPFRFIGTDPAADPALVATHIDSAAAIVRTGFDITGNSSLRIRLNYAGEFGKGWQSHSATAGLRVAF